MQLQSKVYGLLFSVLSVGIFSCKKDNTITPPPAAAEFMQPGTLGQYFIKNDPKSVFKIPVGITNVSKSPRTVTYTVSSPTGAVRGQQYNLSDSVIIPAGTAVDSISLNGIYGGYNGGRIDTLIFTLTGGDPTVFKGFETYEVVLQQYCDVVESQMTGDYTNTIDYFNGSPSSQGPYTATITNWVSTGPTTATANIINLGFTSDNGWGPFPPSAPAANPGILATFNWTDPAAFSVTIQSQPYFNDGSGISTISASGTFSTCTNTIEIAFVVVYAGNGKSYPTTTVLKR